MLYITLIFGSYYTTDSVHFVLKIRVIECTYRNTTLSWMKSSTAPMLEKT